MAHCFACRPIDEPRSCHRCCSGHQAAAGVPPPPVLRDSLHTCTAMLSLKCMHSPAPAEPRGTPDRFPPIQRPRRWPLAMLSGEPQDTWAPLALCTACSVGSRGDQSKLPCCRDAMQFPSPWIICLAREDRVRRGSPPPLRHRGGPPEQPTPLHHDICRPPDATSAASMAGAHFSHIAQPGAGLMACVADHMLRMSIHRTQLVCQPSMVCRNAEEREVVGKWCWPRGGTCLPHCPHFSSGASQLGRLFSGLVFASARRCGRRRRLRCTLW